MNIILISVILSIFVLFISNLVGNKVLSNKIIDFINMPELIGFLVVIGCLFIIGFLLSSINTKTPNYFLCFFLILIVLILLSIKSFKWIYSGNEILIIFFLFIIILFISLKYKLGEEMGDNTYLMNMVSMTNIRPILNSVNFDDGFYFGFSNIGSNKEFLVWYHFFSFLTLYSQKITNLLNLPYIPSSILFVWAGNFIFYFLSATLTIFVIKRYEIKSKLIISSLLILSLYWGTVYYNLVLAHYGSNFVSLFVIGLWLLLLSIKEINYKSIIIIILNIYAIASMGNVGLISSAYVLFAYVLYEILSKNKVIFYWIPFLLFPIFHWLWILGDIVPIKWLIPAGIVLSLLSLLIHYIEPFKNFIYKYILYIICIVLVLWYSISIFTSDNFMLLFYDFFAPKSNFDRLQDYFSFVNLFDALRNIAYYLALISLFLNSKTKKIGWMVLIIILFFINPIVYPTLYPPLQWLYHRAYISAFNIFVIMSGTYSLMDFILSKKFRFRYILAYAWILLILPLTYQQITGYFHRIYIPGPDFNIFYKMDNAQIDVLEKLRQIVTIEKYENAKVISQIYGTTIYVPEVYHMYSNFSTRRIYDPSLDDSHYEPLFRIFFTPVFPGDDGPRFNAPYKDSCSLLIENRIDFIIYDKELSVYDDTSNNWIPLHWYARSCAEKTYENERYIMYRFYWK